jgi:hypothetical protein
VDSLEVEEASEVEETVDAAIVVGKSIVVTASGGCCRVVVAHVGGSLESLIDRGGGGGEWGCGNSYSQIVRQLGFFPPRESYLYNKLSISLAYTIFIALSG